MEFIGGCRTPSPTRRGMFIVRRNASRAPWKRLCIVERRVREVVIITCYKIIHGYTRIRSQTRTICHRFSRARAPAVSEHCESVLTPLSWRDKSSTISRNGLYIGYFNSSPSSFILTHGKISIHQYIYNMCDLDYKPLCDTDNNPVKFKLHKNNQNQNQSQ